MNEDRTLNEVCRVLKVSRRAIQGYEKCGLVQSTGRTDHGYLLYNAEAQQRIRRIRQYQLYGFRLKEMQELLNAPAVRQKALLEKKLEQLQQEHRERARIIEMLTEELEGLENPEKL